jgi:ribosomal protein S18 acetylase RimI-like enzyme
VPGVGGMNIYAIRRDAIKSRRIQNMEAQNSARIINNKKELNEAMGKMTAALSRAFFADPFYSYIMPKEQKRLSQLQWWMRILLKYGFKNGRIYVAPGCKGAAIWFGPDKPTLNNFKLALSGLIFCPIKIGIKNCGRMLGISNEWEKIHKKQNKRHYYLMVIGVDPELQRKGIGGLLLKDILARADNEKLDCHLETMTAKNVMFYERHGFKTIFNQTIKNGEQYWIMKRIPKN